MYVAPQDHFTPTVGNIAQIAIGTDSQNQVRKLKRRQPIFFEGDAAKTLYRVVEGVVCAYKLTIDGRRQVLSFGYPGDIIGINHDGFYHSDCDAISDAVLLPLQWKTDPQFANILLRYAVAELVNMQDHYVVLGRKSAMEKVASFLNVLQDRIGSENDGKVCFSLPMTRTDIADFLGLTIATVSRCFTKLRKEGIISLPHSHQVCVCDHDALAGLVETDE